MIYLKLQGRFFRHKRKHQLLLRQRIAASEKNDKLSPFAMKHSMRVLMVYSGIESQCIVNNSARMHFNRHNLWVARITE